MSACVQADSGRWVPLSNELWNVIQTCDQWNRLSSGAFDAALGALTRLRRSRKSTTPTQWDDAKRKSGWHLMELDETNRSIRFKIAGVRLDFGAIGKGIVVDRIAEKLEEMEIKSYVVNASGNMRIGHAPADTEGWPVSIEVPWSESKGASRKLLRLRLSQCGIATSGDKWQRFPDSANGPKTNRSSHIIDPTTNAGVAGRQSITIIAANATDADAAATATCVRAHSDLANWLEVISKHKPTLEATVLLQDLSSEDVRMIVTGRFPS